MPAGAATADHLDPALELRPRVGGAGREPLHRRRDCVEAMHARAALTRALGREVARHARKLADGARVVGDREDRSGTERRAVGCELGVEEPQAEEIIRRDP